MLTFILMIISAILFFKLVGFTLKLTWGIGKAILSLAFLPLVIVLAVFKFIWLLLPILILGWIVTLIMKNTWL